MSAIGHMPTVDKQSKVGFKSNILYVFIHQKKLRRGYKSLTRKMIYSSIRHLLLLCPSKLSKKPRKGHLADAFCVR